MKKWPEAGIIWCEREQTACAYCSITDGSCTASRCNIRDPEYIERKKEIEETRKHNDQNRQKEKDIEKKDPPAPIRNDSTKAINQIDALERAAKYCFTRGWTQRAFDLSDKASELKRRANI